eukprot:438288_1
MIGTETKVQQVTERHKQVYYYSRCLFEAIEFFGEQMSSDLKVYHGLNKVMYFSRLTAYFNQPISTSPSYKTACEFARGSGLILTLKCSIESLNDPSKTPKYLEVRF